MPNGSTNIPTRDTPTTTDTFTTAIRPRLIDEIIGQSTIINRLRISINAAKQRGEPLEHILFHGAPGLGKTTFALMIANEMDTPIKISSGVVLKKPDDIKYTLIELEQGSIFFIDEIHRLSITIEEFLYSAMEDFRIDVINGKPPYTTTRSIDLNRFTLVGATTQIGLLSQPLQNRFGIIHHLDFYTEEELQQIVRRSAGILGCVIDEEAGRMIASRSRGTPRIANNLLKRVRDCATPLIPPLQTLSPPTLNGNGINGNGVNGNGNGMGTRWGNGDRVQITAQATLKAFEIEGIDEMGLTKLDKDYMAVLIDRYAGKPVGVNAIAAILQENENTLIEHVEPFLLKVGYINRTSRGRMVTDKGGKHLGVKAGKGSEKESQGAEVNFLH
jgi:holliday junction DNA helicase RuvB